MYAPCMGAYTHTHTQKKLDTKKYINMIKKNTFNILAAMLTNALNSYCKVQEFKIFISIIPIP